MYAWGYNGFGKTGHNSTATLYYSQPVQVYDGYPTNTIVYKQISVGYYCSAAIKSNGTLWTWGSDYGNAFGTAYFNRIGILGTNDVVDRSSPTQVGANTNWKQVSMGYTHACAVKTDGTLWTWGEMQNKTTLTGFRSSPVQIGTGTNWEFVSSGLTHTAAITQEGYMRTAGNNNVSQSGSSSAWVSNHTTLRGLGATTVSGYRALTGYLAKWKTVRASTNYSHAIKYSKDDDDDEYN